MHMIEPLTGFPDNVLAFGYKGRVTRQDYETVLIPAVENALKKHDKIRLYIEIATDFAGFDPGAMWEDLKIGMEHLTRWERAALVTDVEWIKQAMRLFGFLMPGKMKSFALSEAAQARAWIKAAG
jgi:SpoIIAA-like